jgi:hypothetical protein
VDVVPGQRWHEGPELCSLAASIDFRESDFEIGAPQSSDVFVEVQVDQCGHLNEARDQKLTESRRHDMSEAMKSQEMSRRKTRSPLAAAFCLAVPSALSHG